MASTRSRRSESSTLVRMVSGRLSRPVELVPFEGQPELGGDDHLVAHGGEGFPDEFLVGERAVDLGGVEEGDALVDGGADERDAVGVGGRRAVAVAQAHAAQPEGGHL